MGSVIYLKDHESGLDHLARKERIQASLDRINALMDELRDNRRTAREAWNEVVGLLTWKQYQRVTTYRGKAVREYSTLLLRAKRLSRKRKVQELCEQGLEACKAGRYR